MDRARPEAHRHGADRGCGGPGGPATVLLVEDNPLNLKLARTLLQLAGLRVEVATDADGALAALQARTPDLLLVDIQLPGTDGLALTRQLRADPRWQDLRIVATTAHAMKGDEERFRAAGCDGYIGKPIDQARFADQVARLLPQRGTG